MSLRLAESIYHAGSSVNPTDMFRKGWWNFSATFLVTGAHSIVGGANNVAVSTQSQSGFFLWGDFTGDQTATFNSSLSTTVISGVRLSANAVTSTTNFFYFQDSSFTTHVHIDIASDGSLKAYRSVGTSNLLGSSATGVFVGDSIFHMWEVKIKVHASAGTIDIRKDTVSVLSLSGLNTLGATGDIYLAGWSNANGVSSFYQDFYVCDNQGSTNNDFLGDIRVEAIMPNGAGNYTQFTPLSGSNYTNVAELGSDNTTTYNKSATVGNKDSYAMENLHSTSGTILGINVVATADKTETSPRGFKVFCRSGSTDSAQSAEQLLKNDFSYNAVRAIYEQDPAISGAWTITTVNAVEAGVVVSS